MRVKARNFLVPVLPIVVGLLLMYVGLWGGWGAVWAAAGGYFVVLGLGAELLALSWVAPGRLGAILRHPVVSVLIVAAVLGMMILTVGLGILSGMR